MVEQGHDYDLFDAFRTALRGHEIPEEVAGVAREEILEGSRDDEESPLRLVLLRHGALPLGRPQPQRGYRDQPDP